MKLSSILSKILIRMLYLTPLGPMITAFYLTSNQEFPGILVLNNRIFIVDEPTLKDRLDWIINGIFILAEACFIFLKFEEIGLMFLPFMFAFGVMGIIYGIFPKFSGNKFSTTLGLIIIFIAILLASLLLFWF